jgi:ElaB/YqjD/DUF883 family membrane-anchored ribosome-binding protein
VHFKESPMSTTSTTADAATNARERLATSLQQMVDEAEHLLANAQRTGSEQFNEARDKFEAQLRHAKSELRQLQDSALDNARRAARATDHAVHDHPYAAMGLAGGVGLLLGMLVSRR